MCAVLIVVKKDGGVKIAEHGLREDRAEDFVCLYNIHKIRQKNGHKRKQENISIDMRRKKAQQSKRKENDSRERERNMFA